MPDPPSCERPWYSFASVSVLMNTRGGFLSFCTSSLVLVALCAGVSPAQAQDAPAQAAGRALFNEGVALFNKGEFEAACPKFEASLKQFPGIGTRGKLAECYEKVGRYASAYQAYREVAQLATRTGDPAREQVASERAKGLEPKLSYVTVVLPPANDVTGIVIKRNGREVERAKLGAAEPVDSGAVAIDVTAPGRKPYSGHINVMQGLSVKFEIPALAPEASVVAPAPAPAPTPASPPPQEGAAVHGDPPSWQKPVGLVLIGAGVVGLGVGSILGLSAKSKYDGAFEGGGCDSATKACDAQGQSAVDSAHSTATVSTVVFAAGAVLGVAGVVVLLTAPSGKPRAIHIAPTTYAGGAGLSVGGAL
jgi:hypothetical protein